MYFNIKFEHLETKEDDSDNYTFINKLCSYNFIMCIDSYYILKLSISYLDYTFSIRETDEDEYNRAFAEFEQHRNR